MTTPKFIRNKKTGIIYDFNPAALNRSENDFEAYDGEAVGAAAEPSGETSGEGESTEGGEKEEADELSREQLILNAVKTIDTTTYSAPAAGRPAMPKVGVITELVGFKVSADEVAAAVTALAAETKE